MVLEIAGGLFNKKGISLDEKRAATIVVALDGSGDTDSIQEAINMLPSTGGVVWVKEGTYTITATITITSNNITIKGAGHSTIITSGTNFNDELISVDSGHYFSISDVQLNGNKANQTVAKDLLLINNSSYFYNSHCYITNGKLNGVNITGTAFGSMHDCFLNLHDGSGINIAGGDNNVIANNHFSSIALDGIRLTSGKYHLVTGNISVSNDTNNINILAAADEGVLTGNLFIEGITGIRNAGDRTLILGNNCRGNVDAIIDTGTNTELAHNITI